MSFAASYPIARWSANSVEIPFPDPFADMASSLMPETMTSALHLCQRIFMSNGTYRQAVDRILSYFITDVEISGKDDDEKQKWREYLEDNIDIRHVLHTIGLDAMCFSGDTLVVTQDGVFPIRDLKDKVVHVLSRNGVFRPAQCRSYGVQPLCQVHFRAGRVVRATANHLWFVHRGASNREVVRRTVDLRPGDRVPRVVAPKPPETDELRRGVRHGFVLGRWDRRHGPRYGDRANGPRGVVAANGGLILPLEVYEKPILEYFPDSEISFENQHCQITIGPEQWERLRTVPAPDMSASYWLGFFRGYLAATFFAHTREAVVLAGSNLATLQAIDAQLPRIGLAAWSCRPNGSLGADHEIVLSEDLHELSFLQVMSDFLEPEDILLPSQRDQLTVGIRDDDDWFYDTVSGVVVTPETEEVFCFEERETFSFVIAHGILTHNCYGNAFVSVLPTFKRYLRCTKCPPENSTELTLREVYENPIYRFSWENFEFNAYCPRCKKRSAWKHVDRQESGNDSLRIKRWSPFEIELIWDLPTEDILYIWKIPEHYRRAIREGRLHHLERASWEVVEAVKNNNYFLFEPDAIFHMREDALAGVENRGWGISRVLTNFRQAMYLQVLHRYNESIALDYVVPFRLITPVPGNPGTGADAVMNQDLSGSFSRRVLHMLAHRRRDPASWHVLPFPVNYQVLGGEARQLAPHELIAQATENLLNGIGMPVELYRGTLQLQAAPASLRLFEASMSSLPRNFNRLLRFLVQRISHFMSWESVSVKVSRVTHADDLQRQQTKLQLMMGGQVSPSTGLRSVGLDYREEIRRTLDDQRFAAEQQAEVESEMQRTGQMMSFVPPAGSAAMMPPPGAPGAMPPGAMPPGGMPPGAAPQGGMPPGGMPPGGMPPGAAPNPAMAAYQDIFAQYIPPPNAPVTPEEMDMRAQQLATQILGMPESQKDSTLIQLRKRSPVFHAVVSQKIEDMRRQARMQGGAMLLSQQFGRPF